MRASALEDALKRALRASRREVGVRCWSSPGYPPEGWLVALLRVNTTGTPLLHHQQPAMRPTVRQVRAPQTTTAPPGGGPLPPFRASLASCFYFHPALSSAWQEAMSSLGVKVAGNNMKIEYTTQLWQERAICGALDATGCGRFGQNSGRSYPYCG